MSEQVSKWLDGLGLGQYKSNFVEHEVGMQILTEIGDADLREMGVSALGHRKALLKAIELLRQDQSGTILRGPVTFVCKRIGQEWSFAHLNFGSYM